MFFYHAKNETNPWDKALMMRGWQPLESDSMDEAAEEAFRRNPTATDIQLYEAADYGTFKKGVKRVK